MREDGRKGGREEGREGEGDRDSVMCTRLNYIKYNRHNRQANILIDRSEETDGKTERGRRSEKLTDE